MVKNYEKSFDHRSFYFRQQDKRVVQQRCLVGEIKAAMDATNGVVTEPVGDAANSHSDDLKLPEVFKTVSPELAPLLRDMTPHLVLRYDLQEYSVHRDIYRLLCHAVEHSISNQLDKERIPSLWRDLLRVIFCSFSDARCSCLTLSCRCFSTCPRTFCMRPVLAHYRKSRPHTCGQWVRA
jgi:paired amphipathic helix protein Sin3a